MPDAPFDRLGGDPPASPVVISVPHAGRDYPLSLRAALGVPLGALTALEDRYLDLVAREAIGAETGLVQRLPRAWIDLNRGEDERDPRVDEGALVLRRHAESAKLKSGLGLIPRRAGAVGELWRRRFSDAEVQQRITADYRPYHLALATALAAAKGRWGVAVLLDLHSMPPLGRNAARVVIGDRFGRAAAARFVARVEDETARTGHRVALNAPYAGGHILQRHGAPMLGIHAVQVELDRTLYLDAALQGPGPGLPATAAMVRRIIAALADEALAGGMPIAAQ